MGGIRFSEGEIINSYLIMIKMKKKKNKEENS